MCQNIYLPWFTRFTVSHGESWFILIFKYNLRALPSSHSTTWWTHYPAVPPKLLFSRIYWIIFPWFSAHCHLTKVTVNQIFTEAPSRNDPFSMRRGREKTKSASEVWAIPPPSISVPSLPAHPPPRSDTTLILV